MLLGRRNTLRFCFCVLGFGRWRNNKTWPKTGVSLFQNLLIMSHTRPKEERWGSSTMTWVSVIFRGLRTLISPSEMWTTDRQLESRAVKTKSQQISLRLPKRHYNDSANLILQRKHFKWCPGSGNESNPVAEIQVSLLHFYQVGPLWGEHRLMSLCWCSSIIITMTVQDQNHYWPFTLSEHSVGIS